MVVAEKSALTPVAVLLPPPVEFLVRLKSALAPVAVLRAAGCEAKERRITGGRVVAAGCEAVEGKITLSGVEAGIASVWCRGNRLRRRRKRKPGEGEADEKETEPQRRAAD